MSTRYEVTESVDGVHRYGSPEPISDAEFRSSVTETWLNAFRCIRPSDEFLIDVGRSVVEELMRSDLRGRPLLPADENEAAHSGNRTAIFRFHTS